LEIEELEKAMKSFDSSPFTVPGFCLQYMLRNQEIFLQKTQRLLAGYLLRLQTHSLIDLKQVFHIIWSMFNFDGTLKFDE
jgi:hypothetical protein